MKKWLSLIALFSVMAIGAAVSISSANATVLTGNVHALKTEQTGLAEKAYYRHYYYRHYYHHRYYRRHYYHRHYYRHYYYRPYRWCIGLCWW